MTKHNRLDRCLAILLCMLLFMALSSCTSADSNESLLSEEHQVSFAVLTEQLGLSDIGAMDVLAQLAHANYETSIRMAFETGENTYRLWLPNAAVDVTLGDDGLVSALSDGEHTIMISQQMPNNSVENSVDNVDNSVENSENSAKPVENVPDTPSVLHIVSLTSPVNAGEEVTLCAVGQSGVEYDISVRYASGASTAKGLTAQVAADDGSLLWTFRVSARVAAGDYPITIRGGGEELVCTLTVVH